MSLEWVLMVPSLLPPVWGESTLCGFFDMFGGSAGKYKKMVSDNLQVKEM